MEIPIEIRAGFLNGMGRNPNLRISKHAKRYKILFPTHLKIGNKFSVGYEKKKFLK